MAKSSILTQKKFQKVLEDFTCQHCGFEVQGDGYTNHCPNCLWSLHVDINPGDRASTCGGLMKPVALEQKAGELRIVHECVKCGHRKPNRVHENDNKDTIIELIRSYA